MHMLRPLYYNIYNKLKAENLQFIFVCQHCRVRAMEDLELDVDVTLPIFIQLNVKRESEKDWLETSRWVKFQVREKNHFKKYIFKIF